MRRLLTASAILALALFALTAAAGQPPTGADKKPVGEKTDKKPTDPTDAAIAAALATDPDVRVAKAKIQLAEAELAKARQAVTARVVTLRAKGESLKVRVKSAEERYNTVLKAHQAGTGSRADLFDARDLLEAAKAALAEIETELKLLTGGAAPTDAAIATVLANDPDVRVSQAKIQLAEAELTKVRQGVTLRALTVKTAVEEHKAMVEQAAERAAWAERMVKLNYITQAQMIAEREKLAAAKAALARAETELKLLTSGAGVAGVGDPGHDKVLRVWAGLDDAVVAAHDADKLARLLDHHRAVLLQARAAAVKGPIPDRIRAALDKSVKLGAKGERVTIEQALEMFKKEAGLDVTVRGPLVQVGTITSEGEELTVGAWFQLFEDHTFLPAHDLKGPNRKAQFYVREYGILLAPADSAPPDAPTLTEFWKQKPPAKAADPEPAPMPKKK